MSITAIPILGRIFIELNYSKTRVASLIISSAAIDDVIGWFFLGIITTLVTASFNLLSVIKSMVLLISFSALVIHFGKKHLSTYIQRELVKTENLNTNTLFTVIFCLLLSAIITSYIGIYAIFGGFLLGFSLHSNRHFVREWNLGIGRFINIFFLPLFFAYTGLKINISLLSSFVW